MTDILKIQGLNKKYKGFALQDITFSLEKGYVMGFVGPNGAGKSTTIKLIMNLLKKDRGKIEILGKDNITDNLNVKEKIGFVYDENYFYEELTLLETKKFVAPFYSKWDDSLFNHYMEQFELPSKKKIKELSKGMKLKFSLALALSHHPQLLIMDEPTSGLDPVFRSELLDILREYISAEEGSILFSTHITSDLEKIADYITCINQGKIVFSLSKEELQENYILVKGTKDSLNEELKQALVGIKETKYGFEGLAHDGKNIRKKWQDTLVLERPSLDEIMLFTIGRYKNV